MRGAPAPVGRRRARGAWRLLRLGRRPAPRYSGGSSSGCAMALLLLLLACDGGDKPDGDDTGGGADSGDSADTGDSAESGETADSGDTGGAFTVTLPAATPYEGELGERCGQQLSVEYECRNPNPEVRWAGAPAGTVAFALVLDDPDAGEFDHWAVVNLPGDGGGIDAGVSGEGVEGTLPGEAYELENGFGFVGYLGSCPPEPHVYRWRLWALSAALDEGLSRFDQVERQAEAAALGLAETCHVYGPRSP